MNEALDLCIRVNSPPANNDPKTTGTISLSCLALGLECTGGFFKNPFGPDELADLQWYLEVYWKWPYEGFYTRAKGIEIKLADLGKRLYEELLRNHKANSVIQTWRLHPQNLRQLTLMSDLPEVLALPWELLHDEQGFLCLRTRNPIPIVRRLPQSELSNISNMNIEGPLRILVIVARPNGTSFIDPRSIAKVLLEVLREKTVAGDIAIEFLRPPTLPSLRSRLTSNPNVHILHFDGHGDFNCETQENLGVPSNMRGEGYLAFEDDNGDLYEVRGSTLAQVLQDSSVRLAVLNACRSAMNSPHDAFSSVAANLIRSGVDAVVAMNSTVLVATAACYVRGFYKAIADGISIPISHERARQSLHDDRRRHMHRRYEEKESKFVEMVDWWVPQYYQQREVVIKTSKEKSKSKPTPRDQAPDKIFSTPPRKGRYGFEGRTKELHLAERYLLRGRIILIHGFGGVGKTSFVLEVADWLIETGIYSEVIFVSFEQGCDSSGLIRELASGMKIHPGNYDPEAIGSWVPAFENAINDRRPIIIADNLESIFSSGDSPLTPQERNEVWKTFNKLSELNFGIAVTTRNGDQLAKEFNANHCLWSDLYLGGLHPEDAYALAQNIFQELDIDPSGTEYEKLRKLLEKLDFHPLSIQLVLTALKQFRLDKVLNDFVELLPHFKDEHEAGRNRSLITSLEYSLKRLSDEERNSLRHLTIFNGGAREDFLIRITAISPETWITLRQTLYRAGLINPEQIHQIIQYPYIRFHPTLIPFIRNRFPPPDQDIKGRYAFFYYSLTANLNEEDSTSPDAVRTLISYELPNLLQALRTFKELGKLGTIPRMATPLLHFLQVLNLNRQYDETLRWVDATVPSQEKSRIMQELSLAGEQYRRGYYKIAYDSINRLIEKVDSIPKDSPFGGGSQFQYECLILKGRCLKRMDKDGEAEEIIKEVLKLIDQIIKKNGEKPQYLRDRCVALIDLSTVMINQGKFDESQKKLDDAFAIAKSTQDIPNMLVIYHNYGRMYYLNHKYENAEFYTYSGLELAKTLEDAVHIPKALELLGVIALAQDEFNKAEDHFIECLPYVENQQSAGKKRIYGYMARIAEFKNRTEETENWRKKLKDL